MKEGMTCYICRKIAHYEVPGADKFFCRDHKAIADKLCKKTCHLWDRVHYPDGIGKGLGYSERIWM